MLELQTLKQLADKSLGLVFDGQLWKDYQQALILLCGECTEGNHKIFFFNLICFQC